MTEPTFSGDLGLYKPMQLYRLSATSGVPSGKNGDYTGIGGGRAVIVPTQRVGTIKSSVAFLHQPRQRRKRVVRRLGDFRAAERAFVEILLVGVPRVFVVMAIQTYLTVRLYSMRQ